MKFLRIIITIALFVFYHTALAATSCDQEYSYYLDNDDKPDIIKFDVGHYVGAKEVCSQTLHLSASKIDLSLYLEWNSDFFESYQLLKEHKKNEVVVSYQRENYQEIQHYKMLDGDPDIYWQPYIDTIDYIYPDKTLHKKFEKVRWDLRREIFLIKDKNSSNANPTYSKVKNYQLSNKQLLDIIEMGDGSSLIMMLKKYYNENRNPYSALYLSKILNQYRMPIKSKQYFLNYLRVLANKKTKSRSGRQSQARKNHSNI